MSESDAIEQGFDSLATSLSDGLHAGEHLLLWLAAEDSDFARFNRGTAQQAGQVSQASLELTLIDGQRQAGASLDLTHNATGDIAAAGRMVSELRSVIAHLPEDPYLNINRTPHSTVDLRGGTCPHPDEVIDDIEGTRPGRGELVGIYAGGVQRRGFANSLGQRNWFSATTVNFDWSVHLGGDRAVKCSYAGSTWHRAELDQRMRLAEAELEALGRPPKRLSPGAYRAYLAPAALVEVLELLSWGGFSLKSQRTRNSCLARLADGEAQLDASLTLYEDSAKGCAPGFQREGFVKPPTVSLVENGTHAGALVGPRSAMEFARPCNGAGNGESPDSLTLAPGTLSAEHIVQTLGTGIYVSNLWYMNFSDKNACRMTGMTRFATFWVEGGEIVAPLAVMRFDESLYRLLGTNLVGLTDRSETILSASTYGERSTDSWRSPGALVEDFRLTL
ncbi:MAG: metallopeptidase TldD-related protein [Pseudomonadota bacterium]